SRHTSQGDRKGSRVWGTMKGPYHTTNWPNPSFTQFHHPVPPHLVFVPSSPAIAPRSTHQFLGRDHGGPSRPRGRGAYIAHAMNGNQTRQGCQAGNQARLLATPCV